MSQFEVGFIRRCSKLKKKKKHVFFHCTAFFRCLLYILKFQRAPNHPGCTELRPYLSFAQRGTWYSVFLHGILKIVSVGKDWSYHPCWEPEAQKEAPMAAGQGQEKKAGLGGGSQGCSLPSSIGPQAPPGLPPFVGKWSWAARPALPWCLMTAICRTIGVVDSSALSDLAVETGLRGSLSSCVQIPALPFFSHLTCAKPHSHGTLFFFQQGQL
jgi:hypothetical protein